MPPILLVMLAEHVVRRLCNILFEDFIRLDVRGGGQPDHPIWSGVLGPSVVGQGRVRALQRQDHLIEVVLALAIPLQRLIAVQAM